MQEGKNKQIEKRVMSGGILIITRYRDYDMIGERAFRLSPLLRALSVLLLNDVLHRLSEKYALSFHFC